MSTPLSKAKAQAEASPWGSSSRGTATPDPAIDTSTTGAVVTCALSTDRVAAAVTAAHADPVAASTNECDRPLYIVPSQKMWHGESTWVTVGVGANVIEASWGALVDGLTFGLRRHHR